MGVLTCGEMTNAMTVIVHWTQEKYLADVIKAVKNNLPVKGAIRHLTPFLNKVGLLMVGG